METKVDSSSPVGVLEDYFKSERLETCCSREEGSLENSKAIWGLGGLVKLLRTTSKKSLSSLHPLGSFKIKRWSSMKEKSVSLNDFHLLNSPTRVFSLSHLQAATNNFAYGNLIGKGGYAEVYRGCLANGQVVAIKKQTRGSTDEIIADFLSELGIMAHLKHPNIARLIGYGIEGGVHLVLQLSPNGSLASMLYGSNEKLKWSIRYKIAIGSAEGLLYLHKGCQRRVIHRDIKAANILLTKDFEPQICDFGLAKWLPEHWTHHTVSKFEGTFGYLAPEYLMHGIVDEKTDVFAFGVLLLELVTGRRALDYSQQSLVLWAKPLLKKNKMRELIDLSLGNDFNSRQINLVLLAASLCIQQSSSRRPQMTQVVEILNGNLSCLKSMKKLRMSFFRKAFRDELSNSSGALKSPK